MSQQTSMTGNGVRSADLDEIRPSSIQEDPVAAMRSELSVWIDMLVRGQTFDDPVFEGMVRDFAALNQSLITVLSGVDKFMSGVDAFCDGLVDLSEALVTSIGKSNHRSIASDCCKFRECASSVSRSDAPHSIIAKLKRDLEFNVTGPLRSHTFHNKKLRKQLENRKRRLQEYINARKILQSLKEKKETSLTSQKYLQAEANVESTRIAYDEVDRPVFEWLLMLEEYKGDIYDSLLQTLKYLQYEFFAGSAHCVSHVLPTRMEFRPLVEMTPEQLEPQVEMELNADRSPLPEGESVTSKGDATTKILQRWERGEDSVLLQTVSRPSLEPSIPVDPLSLSVLGFDESQVRRALRFHNNDAQSAMECLLENHDHSNAGIGIEDPKIRKEVQESVRIPSTLKWVQKLKDHRAQQRNRQREAEIQDRVNPEEEGKGEETQPYHKSKHSKKSSNRIYQSDISSGSCSDYSHRKRHRRQKKRSSSTSVGFKEDYDRGNRKEGRQERKKGRSMKNNFLEEKEQKKCNLDNPNKVSYVQKGSDTDSQHMVNPLSTCRLSSDCFKDYTSSDSSYHRPHRHRHKQKVEKTDSLDQIHKSQGDVGDLLLLDDAVPTSLGLTPSLPQLIKPFSASLCKLSKDSTGAASPPINQESKACDTTNYGPLLDL